MRFSEPEPAELFAGLWPGRILGVMASDNKHAGKHPNPNSRPDPAVKSFLDYLRVEKGLAPLTVSSYQSDLVQFAEFLSARRRTLPQARREDVRGFLSQLFA